MGFWAQRLAAEGIASERVGDALRFADPEGLGHELVLDDGDDTPLPAQHPEVPEAMALRGFAGVRAYSDAPARSGRLLEELLGAAPIGPDAWELRGEHRGATIAYDPPPALGGRPSAGTVHHVAWGTTVPEHPLWFAALQEAGVASSPVIDRHYFHAIYFREPSGVLFEISDDEPGFTVDAPLEELGSTIILPPGLEPQRAQIEARLTPLPDPRAAWATR